jgi:hypothetical protein
MEVDVRRSLIGGVITLLCLLLMGAPNAQAADTAPSVDPMRTWSAPAKGKGSAAASMAA